MSDPPFQNGALVAHATEVKARHEDDLLKMPGVVAVGVGEQNGEVVIKVFVKKDSRSVGAQSAIPANVDGLRIVTEVTEEFTAY